MSHVHGPRPIVEPLALRALFSTAVWGEAYVDRFLRYSLPTQLGAGNIGAFDKRSEYLIITDGNSVERFKASAVVQALSNLVTVEYADLDEVLRGAGGGRSLSGGDKYSKLAACQNFVLRRAVDFQALFFGYGDALWADGSYATAAARLAQGYDAVFAPGYPVIDQGFSAAVRAYNPLADTATVVPPRTFAQWIHEHLHPMALANDWHAEWFSHCPSYVIWKVPEQGVVIRSFHMHPVAVRVKRDAPGFLAPFKTTLDEEFVARLYRSNARVYVCPSTDEIGVCSFQPYTGDSYAMQPRRLPNVGDLSIFAERYAGLTHRELFAHSSRLIIGDGDDQQWQRAEAEAETLSREVHRRLAIPDSVLSLEAPAAYAARMFRLQTYAHWGAFDVCPNPAQLVASGMEVGGAGTSPEMAIALAAAQRRQAPLSRRLGNGAVYYSRLGVRRTIEGLHRVGLTGFIRVKVLPLFGPSFEERARLSVMRLTTPAMRRDVNWMHEPPASNSFLAKLRKWIGRILRR